MHKVQEAISRRAVRGIDDLFQKVQQEYGEYFVVFRDLNRRKFVTNVDTERRHNSFTLLANVLDGSVTFSDSTV